MSISLVTSNTDSQIDGGTVTMLITGVQENDVILAAAAGGGGDYTATFGDDSADSLTWATLVDAFNSTAGADTNLFVGWARVGATDTAFNITITGDGAQDGNAGLVYVLRGVDTVTAIDSTTTEANGTNSQPDSPNITGLTTTDGGAWVFSIVGNETLDAAAATVPSGYSNRLTAQADDNNDATVGGATNNPGSSSENPGAWSNFTASAAIGWLSATVALRPASTGGVENDRTETDGVFILDQRESTREATQRNNLFVNDDTRTQALRSQILTDLFLLDDADERALFRSRLATDPFFLSDTASPQALYFQILTDFLFLFDSETTDVEATLVARQWQLPGGAFANEDFNDTEWQTPGGPYLNEASGAPAIPLTTRTAIDNLLLFDEVSPQALYFQILTDLLFLFDSETTDITRAQVINTISELDNLFLFDTEDTLTVRGRAVVDLLFVLDVTIPGAIRSYLELNTALLNDFNFRDQQHTFEDKLLLADQTVKNRASALVDTVLLSDVASLVRGVDITAVDPLLLNDATLPQEIRSHLILDSLLLQDFRTSVQKHSLRDLLLTDSIGPVKTRLSTLLDSLLLFDSVDASTLGIQTITAIDTLLLSDAQRFILDKIFEEGLFLDDAARVGRTKLESAIDNLFLDETDRREILKAIEDTLLLFDTVQIAATGVRTVSELDNIFLDDELYKDLRKSVFDAVLFSDSVFEQKICVRNLTDFLFLSDNVNAVRLVTNAVSALDSLFLFDDAVISRFLERALIDNLLLFDSVDAQKVTGLVTRSATDNVFLLDNELLSKISGRVDTDNLFLFDNETLSKFVSRSDADNLLVLDTAAVQRLLITSLLDTMFLSDTATFQSVVTALFIDGVFVNDLDRRELLKTVTDDLFVLDILSTGRVTSVLAAVDSLLINDLDPAFGRALDRIIADEILLLDFETKQRELLLFDDLLLSDTSTLSRIVPDAFPLVYAALRSVDFLSPTLDDVDFMGRIVRAEDDFMGMALTVLSAGAGDGEPENL